MAKLFIDRVHQIRYNQRICTAAYCGTFGAHANACSLPATTVSIGLDCPVGWCGHVQVGQWAKSTKPLSPLCPLLASQWSGKSALPRVVPTHRAFLTSLSAMIPANPGIARLVVFQYFGLVFDPLSITLGFWWHINIVISGFDCIWYVEANCIVKYGLFLHRGNAKIDISKKTDCYKRHIVMCGIIISGFHCTLRFPQVPINE